MGGALAIPVTEILAYCELYYIAQLTDRDRLFRYVRSIDSAYLEHIAQQQKKSAK